MNDLAGKRFFVTGGTLHPNSASYVSRSADEDLYISLLKGEFCYVLNARQMGKSSLMARTAARLDSQHLRTAIIDLTAIGQNVTLDQWYYGLASQLLDQLEPRNYLTKFWDEHSSRPPHQRWSLVLSELLLEQTPDRIVIFIDEIDLVRSLPFPTNEFFAGIRELYNRRSSNSDLNRVTICLLGVATPADLIDDPDTTPFNVGQRIYLGDFTFEEAQVLGAGLNHGRNAYELLRRAFYWTDGHPYLTQRLCRAISEHPDVVDSADVDSLCASLFLSPEGRDKDDNLLFVRDRLGDSNSPGAVLQLAYLRILKRKRKPEEVATPSVRSRLILSGAVKLDGEYLRVRNRLYERVFDRRWVLASMPGAEARRLRKAFWVGFGRAATLTGAVSMSLALGLVYAELKANEADRARNDALIRTAQYQDLLYSTSILSADRDLKDDPPLLSRATDSLTSIQLNAPAKRNIEWSYLWKATNPSSFRILQQASVKGPWEMVALDSTHLVRAEDRNLLVLDKLTGNRDVRARTSSFALHLTPLSRTRVLAVVGNEIQLWNLVSGKKEHEFSLPNDEGIRDFAVSSDQQLIAVRPSLRGDEKTGKEHFFQLSDVTHVLTKKVPRSISEEAFLPGTHTLFFGHGPDLFEMRDDGSVHPAPGVAPMPGVITLIQFNPSGSSVAIYALSGIVRVLDTKSWSLVRQFNAHGVEEMRFTPDGKALVTIGGGLVEFRPLFGGLDRALQCPFASLMCPLSDGGIAVDGPDQLFIWNPSGDSAKFELGHEASVFTSEQAAFCDGGRKIVSESGRGALRVWDAVNGREMIDNVLKDKRFVSSSLDGSVRAIAGSNGIELTDSAQDTRWTIMSGPIWSLRISIDGRRLLVLTQHDEAILYDVPTRSILTRKPWVYQAALSNDGRSLAAIAYNPEDLTGRASVRSPGSPMDRTGESVYLWSQVRQWRPIVTPAVDCSYYSLVFSPLSKTLLLSRYFSTPLRLVSSLVSFDAVSGELISEFNDSQGENHLGTALAYTPDGLRVLDGSDDGLIRIRNAQTMHILLEIQRQKHPYLTQGPTGSTTRLLGGDRIEGLECSPDGTSFAASFADGMVSVWRGAPLAQADAQIARETLNWQSSTDAPSSNTRAGGK